MTTSIMRTVERIKSRRNSPAAEVAELLSKRERRAIPAKATRRLRPRPVDTVRYDVLGRLMAQKRASENLSLREVARLTGISASTLSRVENGHTVEPPHLFTLTRWLEIPVESVAGEQPQDAPQRIKAILLADPNLDKDEADALCATFAMLYRQIAHGVKGK